MAPKLTVHFPISGLRPLSEFSFSQRLPLQTSETAQINRGEILVRPGQKPLS